MNNCIARSHHEGQAGGPYWLSVSYVCYSASCPSRCSCSARFGFVVRITTACFDCHLHRLFIIHRPFIPPFIIFPSYSLIFTPAYISLLFLLCPLLFFSFLLFHLHLQFLLLFLFNRLRFLLLFLIIFYFCFITFFSDSFFSVLLSLLNSFFIYISLFLLPSYTFVFKFCFSFLFSLSHSSLS